MFNLEEFISKNVIMRATSMFEEDIRRSDSVLEDRIEGRSVLVIGGAGTIGSNFIKAILRYHPMEIVVVDINENGLAEIVRDLRSDAQLYKYIPDTFLTYPMDYDSDTFNRMFINHRRKNSCNGFDIVANFSAHKHVRSEKDIFSIEAMLKNNLIKAKRLLDLLESFRPEVYFCVSTDKASNPVNIMGASKRIMEDLIFSYSDLFPVKTARFANVAFSNGSLPDGFLRRIELHQPLSAPKDVRRYFVSPEESGQICMLAAILGNNREIFFPKLKKAQMITFDSIAVELLHSYGLDVQECSTDIEAIQKAKDWKPGQPYPVYFGTSDTSGEKAFEEFYVDGEVIDEDRYSTLGVIREKPLPDKDSVISIIGELDSLFNDREVKKADIVNVLSAYLPNFNHIETGKTLDSKM